MENKFAQYWIEVDKETKEPTGNICWAYFMGDCPAIGYWIKVKETGQNNIEELPNVKEFYK